MAGKSRTVNLTCLGWFCYLHWSPKPNNHHCFFVFLLCRHWRNVHKIFLNYMGKIKLFTEVHAGQLSYLRSHRHWWARSELQVSDSKHAKYQVQLFFSLLILSFLINYGNLIVSIYEAFTRFDLKTCYLFINNKVERKQFGNNSLQFSPFCSLVYCQLYEFAKS